MTIAAIVLLLAAANLFILSLCRAAADGDDLDERIAPHVPTPTDERVGWVGFSRGRWQR